MRKGLPVPVFDVFIVEGGHFFGVLSLCFNTKGVKEKITVPSGAVPALLPPKCFCFWYAVMGILLRLGERGDIRVFLTDSFCHEFK